MTSASSHPVPPLPAVTRGRASSRVLRRIPPASRRGAADALPVVAAYVPFALTLGAAMAATRVSPLTAWSSSWVIFAGGAQLVTVQMLGAGAPALLVVTTALVVNARHLLYSASLATRARGWPARWRLAGAYVLADPVFALTIARYEQNQEGETDRSRFQYLAGVGAVFWPSWQLLVGLGVLLGQVLPPGLPLGTVTALTFLLLVLQSLRGVATVAAAAGGGVVALLTAGLPLGLNLVAGAAAGIAAGWAVGGRRA
jgi:predicted branched-subunit amino acid permease